MRTIFDSFPSGATIPYDDITIPNCEISIDFC
jgi:hypothetical protein